MSKKAKTKRDFQRVHCLVLQHDGWSSAEIGEALSLSAVTVRRVWRDYRQWGDWHLFYKDRRGGRYREIMTEGEEEPVVLAAIRSIAGGEKTVRDFHRALEKRLSRKLSLPWVYRLLHRYGWHREIPPPSHALWHDTGSNRIK